ncbi:MAG: nucleotide excision repair endonuclease [Lentisphaeria bacterium]|nr:nucleotide excision repair endonuclease [Lentisphaeria bacterium]
MTVSEYHPGEIPAKPGVYVFRDRFGTVIYVGKAVNLRRRLGNYFQPARSRRGDPKLRSLINSIADWNFGWSLSPIGKGSSPSRQRTLTLIPTLSTISFPAVFRKITGWNAQTFFSAPRMPQLKRQVTVRGVSVSMIFPLPALTAKSPSPRNQPAPTEASPLPLNVTVNSQFSS